jgi:putative peptide zinc metalloprotease protein
MNDNRITLTLPPNERWLPLAEHATRRYVRLTEVSQQLEEMIAFSMLEASEELLRRAKELNIYSEYNLSLDLHSEAIVVEISYNGKIPLNPHLTEDYEVPAPTTGIDCMELTDLDSLWLHLIKKQMDRVFFQMRGGLHLLKMVKYRRSEGEELRLWSLGLSPNLKDKLNVEWIERDGHLQGGLLQDLQSQRVLRLGAKEAFVTRKMDGKTTLYEIYLECVEIMGPFTPQLITSLSEELEAAGMLADPKPERKRGKVRAVLDKILNPVFSIPRADAVVEAMYRIVRPLVSPAGVVLCLLIGFSGIVPSSTLIRSTKRL